MKEPFELDEDWKATDKPKLPKQSEASAGDLKLAPESVKQPQDPSKAARGIPVPIEGGSILSGVIAEALDEPQTARQSKLPLESRILYHDKEMTELEYSKDGHYYTDGFRRIAFVREKDAIRAHVFLGYDLSKFVPIGKTIKAVPVTIRETQTTLDLYLIGLGQKYLTIQERKFVGIGADIKKSRVVFEYSVPYNPDDKENLQKSLDIITVKANKLHEVMAGKIKTRTGQDKETVYLTKDEVKDTYRVAKLATQKPKQQNI